MLTRYSLLFWKATAGILGYGSTYFGEIFLIYVVADMSGSFSPDLSFRGLHWWLFPNHGLPMEGFCQQGDKRASSGGACSSLATDVTARTCMLSLDLCSEWVGAYVCFVPSQLPCKGEKRLGGVWWPAEQWGSETCATTWVNTTSSEYTSETY